MKPLDVAARASKTLRSCQYLCEHVDRRQCVQGAIGPPFTAGGPDMVINIGFGHLSFSRIDDADLVQLRHFPLCQTE